MSDRVVRWVEWGSPIEKANWLDGASYLDASLPLVRDVARRFAIACDPNDKEGLARDLHRFVRDAIHYIHDPVVEEFSDAQQVLEQGYGDCDDKIRCFVALCASVRIDAHVRPVFERLDEGPFVHVQACVRWPGSERDGLADPSGYLPAELIIAGIPIGVGPRQSFGYRGRILV